MLVLVGFASEQDSCSLACLVVVERRNQAWVQPGVAAAPLYCSAPIAVAVVEDVSGTAAGPLVADFAGSEKERLPDRSRWLSSEAHYLPLKAHQNVPSLSQSLLRNLHRAAVLQGKPLPYAQRDVLI